MRAGTFGVGGELEFGLRNWEAPGIQVQAPEFRLYRNDALAEVVPRPGAAPGPDMQLCGGPGGEPLTVSCAPGDEMRLTFACRDDFGLAYEFAYACWQVTADGAEEQE